MKGIRLHAALIATALVISGAAPALGQTTQTQAELKRTADGKPDFSGAWTRGGVMGVPGPGIRAINDARGICVINCGPAPEISGTGAPAGRPTVSFPTYKPEFKDKVAKLNKEQVTYDPALRCVNPGLPRIGPPDKIMQTPKEIAFLYDDLNGAFWRIIPLDGRGHREDAEQNFFGDSIGRWNGDTLVIETNSFSDESWLTDNGAFHTDEMTITEEISMAGAQLGYKVTVNDPKVLAEPWVKSANLNATKDPLEPVPCIEKSIGQMTGIDSYHPNPRW